MMNLNEKGQFAGVESAISGLVGLFVVVVLLYAFWPVINNFINLSNTVANFSIWQPMALAVPVFLILGVLLGVFRSMRNEGRPQIPQGF